MTRRGLRWPAPEPLAPRESDVARACDEYFVRAGCDVTKLSQPRRAVGVTAGVLDRYIRHVAWGVRMWIEYKSDEGALDPAQIRFFAFERASGGLAFEVRDVDDARRALATAAKAAREARRLT